MGKLNYRTDDINKKLKQIDELVGSNNNLSNQINNFNSQLDTKVNKINKIETKLLNPEMFRFQGGTEVDDQTAINSALNVAYNTSNELHFYKD